MWETAASLATALGTLVLAVATFYSTRSANETARTAERALAAGLRPLLVSSREGDPAQKVGFADGHFVRIDGGRAAADVTDEAIYLLLSLRNVGAGVAVLHGYGIRADRPTGLDVQRPDHTAFTRLTRDIYIAPGDIGFWQGALRDPADPLFLEIRKVVETRENPLTVYLLYGDVEGGQRVISAFGLIPVGEDVWLASVARHWNLDHADPR